MNNISESKKERKKEKGEKNGEETTNYFMKTRDNNKKRMETDKKMKRYLFKN